MREFVHNKKFCVADGGNPGWSFTKGICIVETGTLKIKAVSQFDSLWGEAIEARFYCIYTDIKCCIYLPKVVCTTRPLSFTP